MTSTKLCRPPLIEQNGGFEENQLIVTADHDHYLTLNEDFPKLLREKVQRL